MFERLRRLFSGSALPPIPDALWDDTFAEIPWFEELRDDERARLRAYAARFVATKTFVGANGLTVDPHMALTIGMLASWPVLHLGERELGGWSSVVVYPGRFRAPRRHEDELTGVVSEYSEDLAGEAWERGPLVLSWTDIQEDLLYPDDGFNVVVHEIAHKLDERGGGVNGIPRLPSTIDAREWVATLDAAFEALCRLVDRGREDRSLIDPYGATSPEEFFAVCSEYHFCRPDLLEEQFPAFAALLRRFYEGDA